MTSRRWNKLVAIETKVVNSENAFILQRLCHDWNLISGELLEIRLKLEL